MNDQPSNQVRKATNREQDVVASRQITSGFIVIEQTADQDWEQNTAYGASRPTDKTVLRALIVGHPFLINQDDK